MAAVRGRNSFSAAFASEPVRRLLVVDSLFYVVWLSRRHSVNVDAMQKAAKLLAQSGLHAASDSE
jgi:hypothetical protein